MELERVQVVVVEVCEKCGVLEGLSDSLQASTERCQCLVAREIDGAGHFLFYASLGL